MSYTGEDVQREAEAYRDWARDMDRAQYLATTYAKIIAYAELRGQEIRNLFEEDAHGYEQPLFPA